MADGVILNPGAGGATVATDDAGVAGQVQIIKLAISADGSATVIPADAANGLDVDVTRSALPTGASTAANQTTVIGHLDGVEGLLTTIDADTGTVAGAVSGLEMQVDVVAPLPAGSNNIGDVDVATMPAVALDAATLAALETISVGTALPTGGNTIGNVGVAGGSVGLLAGAANIGDVNVDSIAAGSNTIGNVGVVPRTTGGLAIGPGSGVKQISAASTNATSVKASAGQVFGWYIYNDGAAEVYFKIYDKASAPTVGTDVPDIVLVIPAGAAANVFSDIGIAFGTGIATAITTGAADSDTGAVAASQVIANLFYS